MKRFAIISLLLTAFIFLLPALAVRGKPLVSEGLTEEKKPENAIEAAGPAVVIRNGTSGEDTVDAKAGEKSGGGIGEGTGTGAETGAETEENTAVYKSDSEVMVRIRDGESIITLNLYDYLLGVVSAEMPASFPSEALKAQAVAARTFTYSRMLAAAKGKPAHDGADVCTDSSHCKAYIPWEEISRKWEELGRREYSEKVENAVKETDGELIFYDEEPIVAVFHAASGAYTEDARDVWGGDVPYLRSVKSPDGSEYEKTISFTADEFKELFLKKHPGAVFGDRPSDWFGEAERSEAGGVVSIVIGGVRLSGRDVRSIFGLPSANFEIKAGKDKIAFTTSGYGHCVGMSQYGARALALKGKNYHEILKWYYTGVEIRKQK